MKKTFFLGLLLPLTLISCMPASSTSSSSEALPSSEESSSSQKESEEISDSVVEDVSESVFEGDSSLPIEKEETYHFYCVNDFHGSILERDENYYESGIAKYFGELKRLKEEDPDHTIILSAGDMYQGSLESNSNYGELVTLAMNAVGFDAMTVGNHEFDYGQDKLLRNIELANFPVLGGNVMKYENGRAIDVPWNEEKMQISTILEKGDAKIGVVGMIGEGQTTSIVSKHVQDMVFIEHEDLAKEEATRLREEEGCDIVIMAIHDSMGNCEYAADKDYFDGVFCGHTHTKEVRNRNGVPFVQSYCNGEAISHFDITIDEEGAYCSEYNLISASRSWEEDEEIAAIRDSFIEDEEFKAKANAVAGTVNGTLAAKEGISNISCKAIYEKYSPLVDDLACTMVNGQRASVSGSVTYSDIYKATPFMNNIVIANVLGADIIYEASYNSTYTGDIETYGSLEPTSFYKIAIIDYVLYHQNVAKQYNYFNSLNPGNGGEVLAEYETYPFDLVFDYIHDDLNGTVNASDYSNYAPGFGLYSN